MNRACWGEGLGLSGLIYQEDRSAVAPASPVYKGGMMKVEYDKGAKAIYMKLADIPATFGVVDHTEELVADTVFIDRTKAGEIYGIEILGVDSIEEVR